MELLLFIINGYPHICSMRFYSQDSSRQNKGTGNRPQEIWNHGKNKKIRFFFYFNDDLEEFNQLATIGHLYLASPIVS